ncbi:molybdopterin cofactor-binding domain-containing protein [Polymorphobacter sp.]|uniref:xanthine dehydrogenase family protein molybdopterin-binding subunit n=1 Tax=Polymorphobacter sp. TaxID=1909290 RepID=UPI003F710BCF
MTAGSRAGLSRRALLGTGVIAGATTLLGFRLGPLLAEEAAIGDAVFAPNAFIRLGRDGIFTLIMPQQEMGQGVHTGHAQLIAEELEVPLAMVRIEHAGPDDLLYGGPRQRQGTGGSNSMRGGFYLQLRQAGADARALLLQAAALELGVPVNTLTAAEGKITDAASTRSLAYADLAARAATIRLRVPAGLKRAEDFKLIGTSPRRLDTPQKVVGAAVYGIDVFPGTVPVAAIAAAPMIGGMVRGVDDRAARAMPGVRQLVVLDNLVAVVAENSWAAIKGMRALTIDWADGPHAGLSQAAIWESLRQDSRKPGVLAHEQGDATAALGEGEMIEAEYELPFLSHAPMEPLNCTVHVTADSCELWVGTQVQTRAQAQAAKVLGLPPGKVTLHNHMLGGAFGRRLDVDMIETAVRIGREVEGPVKVMWTREEDIRQDTVRPVYHNRMAATVRDGHIHGWSHKVSAGSVQLRMSGKPPKDGLDNGSVDGATELPYDIPNQRVDYVHSEPLAVPIGYWRGVGPNNTMFAVECFIDELARAAGRDPVDFRLAMLGPTPRLANAVRVVAEKSGWGSKLPARHGRGLASHSVFGSHLATVAEVEVTPEGDVRVARYVCAIDCGVAVNPDTVIAQIQGGILFGLGAALHEQITVRNGRIEQSNFNDYRVLRMSEAPPVEVHVITSTDAPGGVGEPGTTAAIPSLANAIADATGIRLRRMPIDRARLVKGARA